MYPYKIKVSAIKDPELIKIYLRLDNNEGRATLIPNKSVITKIGWQLKPIRPDIFMGRDSRYKNTHIALKKGIKFEMIPLNPEKTVYNLIFKKIF